MLAERTWDTESSDAARIATLFRTTTGRAPTDRESAVLLKLFVSQTASFANDLPAANKMLAVGDRPVKSTRPRPELAAAATVALTILNHDEAVNRR